MFYAITARYIGPTNHRGSRYAVRWGDRRVTVPYDYAARDAGRAAIEHALARAPAFRDQLARMPAGTTFAYGVDHAGTVVAVPAWPV